MKFIIRDDDINYHFQAEQLAKWYEGIIDICPVSVCIPPFVKGHFFKWCYIAENHLPYDEEERRKDSEIFKIGDNKELIDYLRQMLSEGKVGISLHGITHRNEEGLAPVKGNHIRGAEFYTYNDYTEPLAEAKTYLGELFGIDINSFSPPQNMINEKGLIALRNNGLSLCTDLITARNISLWIKTYGLLNTIRIYGYRRFKHHNYPYVVNNEVKFVDHIRLQPGKNIDAIKRELDYYHSVNGVFVLSTHSYGFDFMMSTGNKTMNEALLEILHYSQKYDDIEYTTLHELFK